jgi:hypothetical protein
MFFLPLPCKTATGNIEQQFEPMSLYILRRKITKGGLDSSEGIPY